MRARRSIGAVCIFVAFSWFAACGGDSTPAGPAGPTGPEPAPELAFDPALVTLGEARTETVQLGNSGTAAAGPVVIVAGAVRSNGGGEIPGATLSVSPSEVATLNPGDARVLSLSVALPDGLSGGEYDVSLEARVGSETLASMGVVFSVVPPGGPQVGSVSSLVNPPPRSWAT